MIRRRAAAIVFAQSLFLLCPLEAQIKLHLIGTGGPELTPARAGAATLIETPTALLLFDAGRGVLDGIYRSRVRPQDVTRVYLTHLQNDHIEGLPTLWLTPWFLLGRQIPLEIWGPPGTSNMIDGMRRMYAHAAVAKGVDVIASNVAAATPEMEKTPVLAPILGKLMRPAQAAALFRAAAPRMAVYSHAVKKHLPGSPGDQVIVNRTRAAGYSGPLIMGLDGMTLLVGASIEVVAPYPASLPDFDWPDAKF